MQFQFPLNIVAILIPMLVLVDAMVRISSPRRYRGFIAWLNKGKSYSEDIRTNLASDRQIRWIGSVMLLVILPLLWILFFGNANPPNGSTYTNEPSPQPIPWFNLLLGLALTVTGTIAYLKPKEFGHLLCRISNINIRFPESEILRFARMFAAAMVVAGLLLLLPRLLLGL